jgi:membrane protein YdbS with pleckstrin-like domain
MKTITESAFGLWLLLIGITIISWLFFEGDNAKLLGGTVVVTLAAIKSRLVIVHYMEAKNAPRTWRQLYETWNFSCAALILIGNAITLQSHS